MTPKHELPEGFRRMIDELALARRGTPKMVQRALVLCRQFKFSPWIAWAVVEGKVTVAEAARLDGAAKCPALQGAILDQNLRIADLENIYPYAPYFLAHELMTTGGGPFRRVSEALFVAKIVLSGERVQGGGEDVLPRVRLHAIEHYRTVAEQILRLRENEGLPLEAATDVVLGLMPLAVARRRMALRREDERHAALEGERGGAPRRFTNRLGPARARSAADRPEPPRPGPRHRALQNDRYT
jgi:hypothetical protein